jgi:hypothetical protein
MMDAKAGGGLAAGHSQTAHGSRAELTLRWMLRFLLPLEIGLGALLFYWILLDDDSGRLIWKLICAVPLTVTCVSVGLWAWEVWQPEREGRPS